VRNQGSRIRELDVTSYAEIVLTTAAGDLAHPAFGKLFVETEYLPTAARCSVIGGRAIAASRALGLPCVEPRGPPQGPVEWETDRARFLGAAGASRSAALDGRALSGTTGVVLDPIVSLRQRHPVGAGGRCGSVSRPASLRSRDGRGAGAQVPPTRRHARTSRWRLTHAESGLRHLGISADDAVLFERLASRVLGPTDRFARAPRRSPPTSSVSPALAALPSRATAHPAGPRRRRAESPAGAQVLQARSTGGSRAARRRRDHQRASVSYLDEMQRS
jgi:cyclic beta-1,2-glucan synthetase